MFQYGKHIGVLFLVAVICCCGVQGAVTEDLNVTYHLGGPNNINSYTDIQAVSAAPGGGYYLGILQDATVSLMKTDAAGSEIWRKTFPGEEVRTLLTLEDGGVLLATTTMTIANDTTGYTFGGNTYLIRADADGNAVWNQQLVDTGAGDMLVTGNQIKFAGWFWESMSGFTQSFLLESGAPANDQIRLGNETTARIPLGMVLADDGTLVLTGGTTASLAEESQEAWIANVKNGITLWDTVIRTGSQDPMYGPGACGYALCKTADGGYMVVGSNPPYRVTVAAGIAWAASVDASGNVEWVKEIEGCYAPYGIVPFGKEYLIAGMSGYDFPVWLTLTSGGATTQLSSPGVQGRFNDIALTSSTTAAVAGWSYLTDEPDGLFITLSTTETTPSTPSASLDGTPVWVWALGGIICLIIVGGIVYFVALRKPASSEKKGKSSGKKR